MPIYTPVTSQHKKNEHNVYQLNRLKYDTYINDDTYSIYW